MSEVIWFTGNTGAGKTTFANKFKANSDHTNPMVILDGDDLRQGVNSDLGMTAEDRIQNNIRTAHLAKLLSEQGIHVLVAVIAPTKAIRKQIKEICNCEFYYVVGGAPNSDQTPYEIPTPDEYSRGMFGNLNYDIAALEDRPKYNGDE